MTVDLEEEIPQLELDEATLVELDAEEEDVPRNRFQTKKERKRLILSDSVHSLLEDAKDLNGQKQILLIVPNSDLAKEALDMLRERRPKAKRSALSVGNIAVAFNRQHLRSNKPDFILIHLDTTEEFLNDLGKEFLFSRRETEEVANALIKQDANRELCRKCREEEGPDSLPYGFETGVIEWKPQFNAKGEPILDDEGNQLYIAYPELNCEKGHRWYKAEGARRNVKGKNPILLDSHYKMRQQREIYVDIGTPDPSYTRDRFDKPTQGIFIRTHPSGRKTNTPEQRKKSGASFYR